MALTAYGVIAALQPSHEFGRVLAAYGGVYIVGSLLWGVAFDGLHPRPRRDPRRRHLPRRRRDHHVRASGHPQRDPGRAISTAWAYLSWCWAKRIEPVLGLRSVSLSALDEERQVCPGWWVRRARRTDVELRVSDETRVTCDR